MKCGGQEEREEASTARTLGAARQKVAKLREVEKLRRQAELKRKLAGLDHENDELQREFGRKLNANERERKAVREQLEKM